ALRAFGDGREKERLVALVGASDGATDAMVEQALAVQGGDENVDAALFGLAVRTGAALPRSTLPEGVEKMTQQQLEKLAEAAPLDERARLLVFGCVAFGQTAPAAWRDQVRALLFATERPYFK